MPLDIPQRIAAGDTGAENELLEYYSRRVYALILARLRDADLARDLTQDVLMGILAAMRAGRLRDPGSLNGFVLGTARNHVSNYYRERSRQPVMEEISAGLGAPAIEDRHELRERAAILRNALRKLNAGEKEILRMTVVDKLPPGEIAGYLGLGADVVRKRKSRALRKLAGFIEKLQSHRRGGSY